LKKIIYDDLNELVKAVAVDKNKGKRIVLANGCFDVIHVGHVRYLEAAAELGDVLIVAVNDDTSTSRLKGAGRPLVPQSERAEIVSALRPVDYVLVFGDDTVDEIIKEIKPDFHAKGTDYEAEGVPEFDTAEGVGCKTVIVGDKKDHSSTDLIEKIKRG